MEARPTPEPRRSHLKAPGRSATDVGDNGNAKFGPVTKEALCTAISGTQRPGVQVPLNCPATYEYGNSLSATDGPLSRRSSVTPRGSAHCEMVHVRLRATASLGSSTSAALCGSTLRACLSRSVVARPCPLSTARARSRNRTHTMTMPIGSRLEDGQLGSVRSVYSIFISDCTLT